MKNTFKNTFLQIFRYSLFRQNQSCDQTSGWKCTQQPWLQLMYQKWFTVLCIQSSFILQEFWERLDDRKNSWFRPTFRKPICKNDQRQQFLKSYFSKTGGKRKQRQWFPERFIFIIIPQSGSTYLPETQQLKVSYITY